MEERSTRFKRYRLLLVYVAGRRNRNNCVMGLRLCASVETITRMQKVWKVFDPPARQPRKLPLAVAPAPPGKTRCHSRYKSGPSVRRERSFSMGTYTSDLLNASMSCA